MIRTRSAAAAIPEIIPGICTAAHRVIRIELITIEKKLRSAHFQVESRTKNEHSFGKPVVNTAY